VDPNPKKMNSDPQHCREDSELFVKYRYGTDPAVKVWDSDPEPLKITKNKLFDT
jgi:hypothetical protein